MAESKHLQVGALGEHLAVNFLTQQGYTILHRNWRHKHLEIDIIASKNNYLHLIEVKTRTTHNYGLPEQAVNQKKMEHLKQAAAIYMEANPNWQLLQFDVVAITLQGNNASDISLFEDVYW
ncbi:MAG TPA: YraN family protein [Chitinophagaceae bacterium]|nr:YraN family protein [Chitinophagaceae bacterium]